RRPVSPYDWPVSVMGADQFCAMLGRQVDFGRIQVDGAGRHPVLLMGAVDVLSGRFRTFNSRRDRITAATVLASAAIPNLFRAVRLEDGTYWDGLFSQNPRSARVTRGLLLALQDTIDSTLLEHGPGCSPETGGPGSRRAASKRFHQGR